MDRISLPRQLGCYKEECGNARPDPLTGRGDPQSSLFYV